MIDREKLELAEAEVARLHNIVGIQQKQIERLLDAREAQAKIEPAKNLPTVSLCCLVHNDLPRLKAVLLHECRWVDQVCILDLASTDGTREFCEQWLCGNDTYTRRDRNTAPELGFAEARNAVMDMATCDWCLESGGNVMMWTPGSAIKETLNTVTKDVVGIEHRHLSRFKECQPHQIEEAIAIGAVASVEFNVRAFIRRNSGIRYRGYIHEEPWRGEVNTFDETHHSQLIRYHFHQWGDHALRHLRYHWMLWQASSNPQLQAGTNAYWYNTYVPRHAAEIRQWAAEYEAHPMSHLRLALPELPASGKDVVTKGK